MRNFSVLPLILLCAFAARTQDKAKDGELQNLARDSGAKFGDWTIWNYQEGGPAFVLANQKTGYVIYLPWSSNGWINFRAKDGEWMVLYSKGEPEAQERKELLLAKLLDQRPTLNLELGKYTFKDWTAEVTKDKIEFKNGNYDDRLSIQPTAAEFVHNGRKIPAK
jgi:hypothetical protein